MSLSISTASPPIARLHLLPPSAARPRPSPAKQVNASTTGDNNTIVQETSALNRVLGHYRPDLAEGKSTAALCSLARQITADAKLLGQTESTPKPPAASATPAAAAGSARAGSGRLDTLM